LGETRAVARLYAAAGSATSGQAASANPTNPSMWNYPEAAIARYLAPAGLGENPGGNVTGVSPAVREDSAFAVADETVYRLRLTVSAAGVIEAAGFEYEGSPVSVASASLLCEMVLRRHMDFAIRITPEELGRALGGLPEDEARSRVYGMEALRDAHRVWSLSQAGAAAGSELVCYCMKVSVATVRGAIRRLGLSSVGEVSRETTAGTGCGTCKPDLAGLVARELSARRGELEAEQRGRAAARVASAADAARLEAIQEVLDSEVRPGLKLDGGGIDVLEVRGSRVLVSFRGACSTCSSATSTMRFLVKDRLHTHVDPGLEIVEAEREGCLAGEPGVLAHTPALAGVGA
jgi:NifU-like protein